MTRTERFLTITKRLIKTIGIMTIGFAEDIDFVSAISASGREGQPRVKGTAGLS
jgi:hypothetical protein